MFCVCALVCRSRRFPEAYVQVCAFARVCVHDCKCSCVYVGHSRMLDVVQEIVTEMSYLSVDSYSPLIE